MQTKLSSLSNTKVSDSEGKLNVQKEFPSAATSKGNIKSCKYIKEAIGERVERMEFKFILVSDREKGK